MPVPSKGDLVLVTGASGFIASWICLYLLEEGFRVRGTTRNDSKGQWMKEMYASRGHENFDFVVVSDLENENAFDEAAKGVDAIVHTASPFHWKVTEPDDFIRPAVAGTMSILKAAEKERGVKRIVLTSSHAAILENKPPGTATFTEEDWNEESIAAVKNEGVNAWRMHWYRASKTLAERTAWDFLKTHDCSFDLATICFPYTLGPIIHEAASPESLNVSIANWYGFLTGTKTIEDALNPAGIITDVRDVARCHVKALMSEKAGGLRFGVCTEPFHLQLLLDYVNDPKEAELIKLFPNILKGKPGAPVPKQNLYDCSRSLKLLDITPTPARKTAIDMTRSLAERQERWNAQAQETAA